MKNAPHLSQKTEAEKNRLIEELIKQNEELRQFVYILSHNLRAPVTNILGLISIFNKETPGDPGNIEVVEYIEKAARNLDNTITDLNQIISYKNTKQEIKEKISLPQIVNLVKESINKQITESGTVITTDFSEAGSFISIKSYVRSILFNLVSNAIKYRHRERSPVIHLKTTKVKGYLCLSVIDNGTGIDLKKQQDKVFGLYNRFHIGIEGTGMGLYTVKTQAEALGGKVEVECELGKGCIFKIYFPVTGEEK